MSLSNRHKATQERGWISVYLRHYRGALMLAIALGALAYLFASALMFTSGYMLSLAAMVPLTVLALHIPSLFVRIFGIGKPFLRYVERLVSHNWVLRMTSHMRFRLYNALASRTSALCSKERLGSLLDLLTDDIGHAQDLFLRGLLPLASSCIVALVVVIVAGAFSWQLCLLMGLLLAIVVIILPLVSALINGARMVRIKQRRTELYQEVSDGVYGLTDWLLAGRQDEWMQDVIATSSELNSIDKRVRRFNRMSDLISQIVFCVVIIVILVWACSVFSGVQTAQDASFAAGFLGALGSENAPAFAPNWIAAFVLCVFPLIEVFMPTSHAALSLDSQRKALKRLDRFSFVPPASHKDEQLKPCGFSLSFTNVSFDYSDQQRKVIKDFTLDVPEGQVVAILGRSGVGKTTLAELLHGDIVPCSGSVRIGGIDACDLVDMMPSLIGVIRQDPFLFNLTLRDNLKIACTSADDKTLIETLEKVGLKALYERLPKGLDTIVQMNGANFSGGEKQRIALARILLADQPIIILDEPFVGIDNETERSIMQVMLNELAGKTILVITHHLQNVELFDRVVFLDRVQGAGSSLSFEGAPHELAQTNELFQKLMRMDRPIA